ncbi:hypothetical protein ACWCWD_02660 [Streptomyces sp. NPDC001493]
MGISLVGAFQLWLPAAAVSAFVAHRVRRGRARGFLRPGPVIAVGGAALLNAATVWFLGFSRIGLDIRESCEYANGVRFDERWNEAHYGESQNFFPLHAKCSATVDLVPAWVNPAFVVLVLLAGACLCLAVFLGVRSGVRSVGSRGSGSRGGGRLTAPRNPRTDPAVPS